MTINDWYKLPTGYSCIDVSGNNYLYAYTGNRRDTYRLNGMIWTRTQTTTSTSSYSCNNIVNIGSNYYVPYDIMGFIILSAVIVILCFFSVILNWFKGIAHHV